MLPKTALVRAKKQVEAFMGGICDIYSYRAETLEGVTKNTEYLAQTGVPCRLSYATGLFSSSLKAGKVKYGDGLNVSQNIKLFLPIGIPVENGSKIVITQNGTTQTFKSSGVMAEFQTHQEVILEFAKEWA